MVSPENLHTSNIMQNKQDILGTYMYIHVITINGGKAINLKARKEALWEEMEE